MTDNLKVFLIMVLSGFFLFMPDMAFAQSGRHAMVIELDGPISSGAATFLNRGIREAENQGAALIIIQMDTPGGLGVSMKTMVKSILNSPIPVVVYVAPGGAGAASAGVLITISAHVAAMAPGTNIGAAHPVQSDGSDIKEAMGEKVLNDMASYGRGIAEMKGRNADWVESAIRESVSVTSDEAVDKNVIDLVAVDMFDLLQQIDGREIQVKSGKVTLDTKDLRLSYFHPRSIDRILMFLSDPTIMAILFSIGLLGIGYEITNPGGIFPGVTGVIALILAFFAMQTLPVDYAGLLLIFLAVILFIAEIWITSYGLLSLGGIISLILGSMMFFDDLGVSYAVIVPFIIVIAGFFLCVIWLVVRAQTSRPKGGMEGLIGETGTVMKAIDKEGMIFVHGEYWTAISDDRIESGENVKVVGINGLVLKVEKI